MHGADVEVELAGSIGHNALEFLEHNFFERLAEGHFVQCDEQLPLRTLRERLDLFVAGFGCEKTQRLMLGEQVE